MIYNVLGKSGLKISALSFGSMRWRSEDACRQIIHRGMDLGMNYIDTSAGYVGGRSEQWSGRAVKGRREQIFFSSKSNYGSAPGATAVRRNIERSLRKTGLDYFDLYQIWGLSREGVLKSALAKGGMVEGVRKAQAEGLIKYGLGFTFHGDARTFVAAVDSGEFLCATVSYNLGKRRQEELLDYAAAHGVGTIIMNPLGGGTLARARDRSMDFLCEGGHGPWVGALRFLLANKSITTALLGFSHLEEVDQDLLALEGAEALDDAYRRNLAAKMAAAQVTGMFMPEDFCTGCGYCRDCPSGMDPTRLMQAMRDFDVYGAGDSLGDWLRLKYVGQSPEEELARCVECGWCEEQCPQHLKIMTEIRKARETFER
jgi:predicted aldo/keto reductase-like oxidoreductase